MTVDTWLGSAKKSLRLAALCSAMCGALCAALPARAAWQLHVATATADHYADDASLQALSGMRRVWELQDLRAPDARGVRSWRSFVEYDCRGARQRVLERSAFAGPKASGGALAVETVETAWTDVPSGSPAQAVLRWACQRP